MMNRNICKRLLCALLCLMMLVASLVILPLSTSAAKIPSAWDGKTVTDWKKMKGTGSEADPYLIATPADYASIVANAASWTNSENQYFKLTADLNFGGKKVSGISASGLAPKLDGDGHTMYNVSTVWGLFDQVGEGTSIKNLHFVHFEASRAATTALIQINVGETFFENVTLDETSRFHSTEKYAAAFIGDVRASVTFENCINEATIDAYNFGGGFIAFIRGNAAAPSNVVFRHCINAGNVTVGSTEATSDVHAGGMFGGMHSTQIHMMMSFCVNVGDIAIATAKQSAANSVGGLIGSTEYHAQQSSVILMENCYNGGDLSATLPAKGDFSYGTGNVGGIIGYFRFGGTAAIGNTFHAGKITVVCDGDSKAWVNGIIGTGTNGELKKGFINLYALNSDVYTNKMSQPAEGGKHSVHGITYNKSVFVAYHYCDLVASLDQNIALLSSEGDDEKIGTADDAVESTTMAIEINKILNAAHPTHEYAASCSTACDVCGFARADVPAHRYDGACDVDCNACGEVRETVGAHTSSGACDASCNVCGVALTPTGEHTVTNACDTTCDVCGVTVKPTHVYDNACDPECNDCGAKRNQLRHTSSSPCDDVCDVCGKSMSSMGSHTYDGACDGDCNGCGKQREPGAHSYDDDADAGCNVCGEEREVAPPSDDSDETDAADKTDDTTTAPDTTAASADGCGASMVGVGALLALMATFGFVLVGKKKDNRV